MSEDRAARAVDSPARPWKHGLLWLAFLGPAFFASYGFANWLASRHVAVNAIVFEWERSIPFLPWTIVPYWLIDLLYAASLLLCATRAELATHVRRLLAAQVIAVGCFIVFPLRFSFERPHAAGDFGWMFTALASFDQPFNQAPSLHIALLVILWSAYARVVPRTCHVLLHIGFTLIGISVLTTWQHHFIDIPTGAWLGAFCIWLFPDEGRSPLARARLSAEHARRRLGRTYAIAALALFAVAIAAGGAWLWMSWAGASLALVAVIYAVCEPSAFQKRADGTIAPAAFWLMAPYFLGAWLNSRWWTRSLSAADWVVPGILLGRIPTPSELRSHGVGAIVDVCAELPCFSPDTDYVNVPMLDLAAPSSAQIERAARSIEQARSRGPVLVCCALGLSRSAIAVAAWLLRERIASSPEDAIARIRKARPAVVVEPRHVRILNEWQQQYAPDTQSHPGCLRQSSARAPDDAPPFQTVTRAGDGSVVQTAMPERSVLHAARD